ncbi:hypothetical protein SmJEL517_g04617 [Synchytrium microbalum]|uniref:Uncharacterized protein n=1 Tax=Synchytrium microbalum TaxID=1806994 RepID=A0A507C2K2_9FUNG|nr:uncharacterized protein SmJEL517_g04617 [Synchytrium microbalum]TPX32186.1 hypothetical protein SmJEL517_g04617 [Synchytrium microbalum]
MSAQSIVPENVDPFAYWPDTSSPTENFLHLSPPPKYDDSLPCRKLRIVYVGAGIGGISFVLMARYRLKNVDWVVYEKNSTFGGTWWENKYPGCRCDVPSHYYSFRFMPNDWVNGYATSDEIQDYISQVVRKFNVEKDITFNATVLSATWIDERSQWFIKTDVGGVVKEEYADVFVNNQGFLNRPKMPDIEGVDSYAGKMLHTARWDRSYDCAGKDIAIIGTGSSGLQVITALAPVVKKLTVYMRTPSWISRYLVQEVLPESERTKYRDPVFYRSYWKRAWIGGEKAWDSKWQNSETQLKFQELVKRRLDSMVKDPVLKEKLTPKYAFGCRRVTPSGDARGFYYAVQLPHVEIVTSPIDRITPEGVVSVGTLRKSEALILATGFENTFIPHIQITGLANTTIQEKWKSGIAKGYKSIAVSGFPNYFHVMSVNSTASANSIHIHLEQAINYVLQIVVFLQQHSEVRYVHPRQDVQDKWNEEAQETLARTVWGPNQNCNGWYRRVDPTTGKLVVTAHWPGPGNSYQDALFKPDFSEYHVVKSDSVSGIARL